MELACPACRRVNVVRDDTPAVCVRCGCELDALVALARAARGRIEQAREALRAGQVDVAREHAARAWTLHRSPAAAALAALAAACAGDGPAVEPWRARWRDSAG